jgi:hypothetical protein
LFSGSLTLLMALSSSRLSVTFPFHPIVILLPLRPHPSPR